MNPLFKIIVVTNVALFRLTGGRLGGSMGKDKILLLTTTGNKSGKPRTVPVMYFEFDGKRYVVGSMGGAPQDPAWIKNLRKTPEVDVEVRGEKYRARASILPSDVRAGVFDKVKQRAANFAEYEKRTNREIPVVELERI
jgi:deazaflavin-dependent oxidoreductase (nitroreductase family)